MRSGFRRSMCHHGTNKAVLLFVEAVSSSSARRNGIAIVVHHVIFSSYTLCLFVH